MEQEKHALNSIGYYSNNVSYYTVSLYLLDVLNYNCVLNHVLMKKEMGFEIEFYFTLCKWNIHLK